MATDLASSPDATKSSSSPRVIVVGAGLIGLLCAYLLRRRGAQVTVVDAAAAPATEATAQNAGMVRRLVEEPVERALALRSHRLLAPLCAGGPAAASDAVGATMAADPALQAAAIGRRSGGLLLLGDEPTKLHDAAAHLAAAGAPMAFIDDASSDNLPAILDELLRYGRGALGPAAQAPLLRWLRGCPARTGFFDPDALIIDAGALATGLLRALHSQGVEVRTASPVASLAARGGRCRGVEFAGGGRLEGDAVVVAAGAWAAALLARAGLQRPLLPLRRSLWQTGPTALAGGHDPYVWIDDAGLYLRPQAGGLLASPCDERLDLPLLPPPAAADGHSRRAGGAEAAALQLDKFGRWLPALRAELDAGRLRLRHGWSGLRTFAPDRAPLIGAEPGLPGLHLCVGLGGFGVSCGAAAAEACVELLFGAAPGWLDDDAVRPDRPAMTRMPFAPDGDTGHVRLLDVGRAWAPLGADPAPR